MACNRSRDYFSFESIRDKQGEVVCYHITMIGTIENGGAARIRSDLGTEGNQKMAFGRITLHGCDRKIGVLLNETDSRVYYHSCNTEDTSVDIISFAAKDWRADEIYKFDEGDRVLLEGRAYIRNNAVLGGEDEVLRRPELSVTVTGSFLLGHARRARMNEGLIPQREPAVLDSESESCTL